MKNLKQAISISMAAHKGQKDKNGVDYFLHPLSVMTKMPTVQLKTIAVLHDVVEDTEITLNGLLEKGFRRDIIDAVDALTHRDNETYEAFIERVSRNELAVVVKIADIHDNLDKKRVVNNTESDKARISKYKKALKYLTK